MQNIGKYLVIIGLVSIFLGLLIWLFGNKLNWFGNLPGDVKIEKPRMKFYAPFASMLLISILLSLIMWIINRFFR